jgi:hypothetical protein
MYKIIVQIRFRKAPTRSHSCERIEEKKSILKMNENLWGAETLDFDWVLSE